jgi:hypothetical protein
MKFITLSFFIFLTLTACGKSEKETKTEKCKAEAEEYSKLPSIPNGTHDKVYAELLAKCLTR